MNLCLLCFQDRNKHQDFYHWLKQDMHLCGDCLHQLTRIDTKKVIMDMQVHVLYEYNEFLENMLFQYKEGRDVALAPVFFHEFYQQIQKEYKGYTLCLCPSSEEKTLERGFHALDSMLSEIQLDKRQPFYKSENFKQSKQHKKERTQIEHKLHLKKNILFRDEKLLLIDDVCTTGSTLHACYQLLKPKARKIKILVLCAHPILLKEE